MDKRIGELKEEFRKANSVKDILAIARDHNLELSDDEARALYDTELGGVVGGLSGIWDCYSDCDCIKHCSRD